MSPLTWILGFPALAVACLALSHFFAGGLLMLDGFAAREAFAVDRPRLRLYAEFIIIFTICGYLLVAIATASATTGGLKPLPMIVFYH